tara:strand:+ start:479 stop:715 length:237 start_codon:yes stop_codon:yes gene_type:complete
LNFPTVFADGQGEEEVNKHQLDKMMELQKNLNPFLEKIKHDMVIEICDDVREAIVNYADKNGVDILVVGSRGMSAISR